MNSHLGVLHTTFIIAGLWVESCMRAHISCAHPRTLSDEVSRPATKIRGNYGVHALQRCSPNSLNRPNIIQSGIYYTPPTFPALYQCEQNAQSVIRHESSFYLLFLVCCRWSSSLFTTYAYLSSAHSICYGHARSGNNFTIAPRRQYSSLRASRDYQYTYYTSKNL